MDMDTSPTKQDDGDKKKRFHLMEQKISIKLLSYLTEEITIRHMYKITLLEKKFRNWKDTVYISRQKNRIAFLDQKREKKKKLTPVLEEPHAYIRWLKFGKGTSMTFVKDSAIVIASGFFIFAYDIRTDKSQLYSACDYDGISCIKGSMEEDLFAFAEKCNEPSIVVVDYPNLNPAFILKDQYIGKVVEIEFACNGLLLSLKCNFAEHRVVIWYWRCSYVLCCYLLDRPHLHPELFSTSLLDTHYAFLQEDKDKIIIQFWYLNVLCDDTVLVKKLTVDITTEENNAFHCMKYDSFGDLYLIDENGNLFQYDKVSSKLKLIIPWKPTYKPIEDYVENEMSIQHFLPRRRQVIEKDNDVIYTEEQYEEETIEPEIKNYNLKYEECGRNDYEEEENIFPEEKKESSTTRKEPLLQCSFVWYKEGIVVSGSKGKLKYYIKSQHDDDNTWVKKWGMIPADPLMYLVTNQKKDRLFGWSTNLGIKEIKPMETSNVVLAFFGGLVKSIKILHPKDNFVLTLTSKALLIWRKKSGRLMNAVNLDVNMKGMTVHESSELVALSSIDQGCIHGIDLSNPRSPKVWPVMKIIQQPFSWIKFLDNDWLIAFSKHRTTIFLLKGSLEYGFEIISTYLFNIQVINMIGMVLNDGAYYGVSLLREVDTESKQIPTGYAAGKLFEVLTIPQFRHNKLFSSENYYKELCTAPFPGHLLALPANIKREVHIYFINSKEGNAWNLIQVISTQHQVGSFHISVYDKHFITFGFDGHVFLYDSQDFVFKKENKPIAMLTYHHRWDEGIYKAIIDYTGQYIISLGKEGNVICSRIRNKYWCTHHSHKQKKSVASTRHPLQPKILRHVTEYEGDFWEDVLQRKHYDTDRVLAECRVSRITKELDRLKELWLEYYDFNQKQDIENRIDMDEFVADKDMLEAISNILLHETSEVIGSLNMRLEKDIHWISMWKKICWKKMLVKLYRINAFDGQFFLENFNECIKPFNYFTYQQIANTLIEMDTKIFPLFDPKIFPWNKLDKDDLFPELKMQKDDYMEGGKDLLEEEAIEEIDEEVQEEEKVESEVIEEGKIEISESDKIEIDDLVEGMTEEEMEEIEVTVDDEDEEKNVEDNSDVKTKESSDFCNDLKQLDLCTEEEKAKRKHFEQEMKKDEKELKVGVREPLTIQDIIAINEELDNQDSDEDKPKIKLITEEDLNSVLNETDAEMKYLRDCNFSEEQKEDFIIETLAKLVEVDVHRFKNIENMEEEVQETEGIPVLVPKHFVSSEEHMGHEFEGEFQEEEICESTKEGELELEEIEDELQEEFTDLNEVERKLLVKKQRLGRGEMSCSESPFSWSDVSIEDIPIEPEKEVNENPKDPCPDDESEESVAPTHPATPHQKVPVAAIEPTMKEEEKDVFPSDPWEEPYFLTGSQSPKFIDIDFERLNEFTCTGIFTSHIQSVKIKSIIEDLENKYNDLFYEQFYEKMVDLEGIKNKDKQILKNVDDLTNICKVKAPELPPFKYEWTADEVPQWIFKDKPSLEKFTQKVNKILEENKPIVKLSQRDMLRKDIDNMEKGREPEFMGEIFRDDELEINNGEEEKIPFSEEEMSLNRNELYDMMDGVLKLPWQEIVEKGVKMPDFVKDKDPDSYNEREKIAMNNYINALKKLNEKIIYHAGLTKQDIEQLQIEIKEVKGKFDISLLETIRKRMLIESCRQSELLKIARMKHRRLMIKKGTDFVESLKELKTEFVNQGAEINIMLKYLQTKLTLIIKEGDKLELSLNKIEKDIFKELSSLSLQKKSIEHLKSVLRMKPVYAEEFEKKASSNELHAMAAYLSYNYKPIYLSVASSNYFNSLDKLDDLKNCPPYIPAEYWESVINTRHTLLSTSMKAKIYKSYVPEMEVLTYDYFKFFVNHLDRIVLVEDTIDYEEDILNHYCKKMELVLPDALVETHQAGDIEEFSDCVYISKNYINKLNKEIEDLEKLNEDKIKELDEKTKSVFDTEQLHKELRIRIKIQENLLSDIRHLKMNSYTKAYLEEYKETMHEPYDTKDCDLIKGEKMKKMIRGYFKKYYDGLKKIEKAKREKKSLLKENFGLGKVVGLLSVENQETMKFLDKVQAKKKEKPLQERNQAIMYKGELSREFEKNNKQIDILWSEYAQIIKKTIPVFELPKDFLED